jgi:dephospho-CoA kinase
MLKVGITGGIGSGKTLVSEIIDHMGFPVYNADTEARYLTNNNPFIVKEVKKLFGDDIYIAQDMDRKRVAQMVFGNAILLDKLNAIIHPVVAKHFQDWCEINSDFQLIFKEAAILFESGAYKQLDRIIAVSAPKELRIQRVVDRDGVDAEIVKRRMAHQMSEEELVAKCDLVIKNDGKDLLTPKVLWAIERLKSSMAKAN